MTESVQRVHANGIDIAYETFGDAGAPPLVLVMGLGTQMLAWPDELCEQLAASGLYVVRFDNRDCGLSTHLDHLPVPSMRDILLRRRPPYLIDDLADDTVGLIDALGLGRVHLVGASMGGFISQLVAVRHPDRLRSLTLMMTSTGSRRVGQAKPHLFRQLVRRRRVTDRHQAMAAAVQTFSLIGSQGYAFDEDYLRDLAGRSYDRAYDPKGYLRQLAAVAAQGNRTRELRRITVPTLVMHGLHDPLVAVSGGLALARTIPRSRLVGFSGMGHDLPRALWPDFVTEITALTRRAAELEASRA